MEKTVRRVSLDGVTLTILVKEESFGVIIDIEEGTALNQKRKFKDCYIKFQVAEKRYIAKKAMHFTLPRQKYDPKQIMVNFKHHYDLKSGLSCTISLAPEFYLSEPLLKKYNRKKVQAEERKKQKQARKRDEAEMERFYKEFGESDRGGKRGPTVYIGNNAFKPYQGGSCSPK